MKRLIYLLAVIVTMAAVWAQEGGVSVVDFTKGAGTWQRRVWKNGGKEFDMSALDVRPEDPENVSECPAALVLPLKFPGDGCIITF